MREKVQAAKKPNNNRQMVAKLASSGVKLNLQANTSLTHPTLGPAGTWTPGTTPCA